MGAVRLLPGCPRWTDPSTWHVTLAFFGEVPQAHVDRLGAELVAVHGPLSGQPISLRLAGAGTFPTRGAPRVVWTGVAGDVEPLGRLARAVGRAARAARVPTERKPFRPHLTLGRWRAGDPAGRGVVAALSSYAGPGFGVSEIVLFRSHLGAQARHEKLLAWSPG